MTILGDYRRNVPGAREPEVLSTVTAIIDKLEVGGGGVEVGGGVGGGRRGAEGASEPNYSSRLDNSCTHR